MTLTRGGGCLLVCLIGKYPAKDKTILEEMQDGHLREGVTIFIMLTIRPIGIGGKIFKSNFLT